MYPNAISSAGSQNASDPPAPSCPNARDAAERPAWRARRLEDHREPRLQARAELDARDLDLGHLGDRVVAQHAWLTVGLVAKRRVQRGQTARAREHAGCRRRNATEVLVVDPPQQVEQIAPGKRQRRDGIAAAERVRIRHEERRQLLARRRQRVDDAVVLRRGRAHPQVDGAWRRDVVAQHLGHRSPVDTAHDLVGQRADREAVVHERLTRLPERALRGESLGERLVRHQLLPREAAIDSRQAGLMRQQLAHGDHVLAALCELGPVLRDIRVEVELAAFDQERDDDCGRPLAARVHGQQRVRSHVAHSEVDDALTADVHRELRAERRIRLEEPSEGVLYWAERCRGHRSTIGVSATSDPRGRGTRCSASCRRTRP